MSVILQEVLLQFQLLDKVIPRQDKTWRSDHGDKLHGSQQIMTEQYRKFGIRDLISFRTLL